MDTRFLSLIMVAATALVFATPALAQEEQVDAVTVINGQDTSNVVTKFFNADDCNNLAATDYDLSLINGVDISQAFLWAGTESAGCEEAINRSTDRTVCGEVQGNPQTVGDNATMSGLSLQALVDTGIVDCENTALEGRVYWIYSFRNSDPGGGDVSREGYGIAPVTVDVTPPNQLDIDSAAVQEGSSFTVTWRRPDDSESIAQFNLYASATDDALAAALGGVRTTAGQNASSITVSAGQLGLEGGEEVYLFVSAVDIAAVNPGEGNEGPLSESTLGIAAATTGFCDDPNVDCSGCSTASMMLANGQPSSGLWTIGLVFAVVLGWRLRR